MGAYDIIRIMSLFLGLDFVCGGFIPKYVIFMWWQKDSQLLAALTYIILADVISP